MSKFLFIAIAIGIIYILLKGDKKKKSEQRVKNDERLKASGDLVQDPICGSYVDRDGHIRVRQGDQVHMFCSYECRDKFLKQLENAKPVEAAPQEDAAQPSSETKPDPKE
ncbi:MAG: transcriptional regulator [Desulfovibrio sp.]